MSRGPISLDGGAEHCAHDEVDDRLDARLLDRYTDGNANRSRRVASYSVVPSWFAEDLETLHASAQVCDVAQLEFVSGERAPPHQSGRIVGVAVRVASRHDRTLLSARSARWYSFGSWAEVSG
jgi:hypothetical protein